MNRSIKDYTITIFLIVLCLWSVSIIFNPSAGKVSSVEKDFADNIHRDMGSLSLLKASDKSGIENTEKLQQNPVILFVTSWCGICHALERKLKSENISYLRVDIEKSEKGSRIYQSLLKGSRGAVPMTLVGTKIFLGDQSMDIISASKGV